LQGRFELRTVYLPGRHSTTWAMPPALYAFRYFLNRVSNLYSLARTSILLFTLPIQLGWQACTTTPGFLLVEMGSVCLGRSQTSILPISTSLSSS
jgi:hypothetical protein